MTLEEIDRSLARWNRQLAAVADNLLELQGDPVYRMLRGSGGATRVQLTGATASQVVPALASIDNLFQQFSLLQPVVEHAARLRGELRPVFGREPLLREITALLEGESVPLPVASLPLAQRTLLSAAANARGMRPADLLASMVQAFASARDAVLAVGRAWDELAVELDAAEAQLAMLSTQAGGSARGYSVESAETLLAHVKAQVQNDPFAACEQLRAQLNPALAAVARSLRASAQARQQMLAAQALLKRLEGLEGEAAAAADVARAKILDCAAPAPTQLGSLRAWLERLELRNGRETPEAIAQGLHNWMIAADAAAGRTAEALRLARLPLETRSELRGRFEALKAKARAYGLAEDAEFARLAGQAEALLYRKPTDLTRSAASLDAYERGLSRRAKLSRIGVPSKA